LSVAKSRLSRFIGDLSGGCPYEALNVQLRKSYLMLKDMVFVFDD
jgi:hypothetical protein